MKQHTPGPLTPAAVETIGKRLAARVFAGRKGHGNAPASQVHLTQDELSALLGAAFEGGYAAAIAKATGSAKPVNPYPSGSMREGWQRGYEGRPMLAAPDSDYARAYAEGQRAAATHPA